MASDRNARWSWTAAIVALGWRAVNGPFAGLMGALAATLDALRPLAFALGENRRQSAAACALLLGCDLALHPIVLWDESRVASNALEMIRTGFSLITTYDFKPDLWNTKPPLLVWLIAGCIRLFGPSEGAVRTPYHGRGGPDAWGRRRRLCDRAGPLAAAVQVALVCAGRAGVVALVGGFYLLRERALPGYLAAVQQWELGGPTCTD